MDPSEQGRTYSGTHRISRAEIEETDMATTEYYKVLKRMHRLTPAEQQRLLEDLAALVQRKVLPKPRSVLDLQGLGKDIWSGIDAQEYVDKERTIWNG